MNDNQDIFELFQKATQMPNLRRISATCVVDGARIKEVSAEENRGELEALYAAIEAQRASCRDVIGKAVAFFMELEKLLSGQLEHTVAESRRQKQNKPTFNLQNCPGAICIDELGKIQVSKMYGGDDDWIELSDPDIFSWGYGLTLLQALQDGFLKSVAGDFLAESKHLQKLSESFRECEVFFHDS